MKQNQQPFVNKKKKKNFKHTATHARKTILCIHIQHSTRNHAVEISSSPGFERLVNFRSGTSELNPSPRLNDCKNCSWGRPSQQL